MPNIGNHVDAIFIPESVNTSTTLKINGGDLNVNNGQFFVDQSTTNVGIGTTQPQHLLDIWGDGPDTAQLTLRQWNNNPSNVQDGPDIRFIASGGTIASPAEMDDNDVIGKVNAFAYDGTSSVQYGGFGWRYHRQGGPLNPDRGSSFSIETKGIFETSNSAKIHISEEGAVGIGTASPITVNLQINGFYNSGTSEYGAPTQYFYTNLSSVSAGTNIGRIIFARNGDSATIAAKSTGTANETDLYFYNRTSGGADNVNNVQNTTPTLKLYHDKTAEFASDLTIGGNLTVNGTTTTINSTTLTVDDKNIVLASGAADSAAADGAGITIDGANESLTWDSSNSSFEFSNRLGIGAPANSSSNFRITKPISGATTYYGILLSSSIHPDVTSTAYYNFVQVRTFNNSGTPYTISNVQGYSATVGTDAISSDSTINNLAGFRVAGSWTAGTNNYGFRGQIDSAVNTNRWNVYMDGSAPNYFAGNVGIGTTNPNAKLRVDWDRTETFGFHLVQTTDNGEPDAMAITNNYDRDIGMVFRTGDSNGANQAVRWHIWNDGAVGGANNNRFNISPGTSSSVSNGITILQDSNVGMGTGSPTDKLHVVGSIKIEAGAPIIKLAETGVTGNPSWWIVQDAGNFSLRNNNTTPYAFNVATKGTNKDTTDFVSFGGDTIDDALRLTAHGTNPTYLDLKGNSANARMRYWESTTERWNIGYDTGLNAFTFYDTQSSTTRMFLYDNPNNGIVIGADDNGNLTWPSTDGAGATAHQAALRVDGGDHAALFCYNNEQSGDPVAVFAKGNEADDNQVVIIAGDGDGDEELLDIRSSIDPPIKSSLLSFAQNNVNSKFRVYGDGRVYTPYRIGVGTTAPSSPLDVIGNFEFKSPDANDTGNTKIVGQFDGTGTRNTYLRIGANENRRASIVFSGVNTSTDASTDYWSIGRGDSDELNASSFFIATGESGGNTAKLVIDSNGDVGIGTDSPGTKLHISGSEGTLLQLDGGIGGTGTRDIVITEFNTSAYGGIIRYHSEQDRFTFGTLENSSVIDAINVKRSTGNVGIGTTNPTQRLHVHGSSFFGGTTSSERATTIDTNGQGFFRYDDNNLTIPLTIENRGTNAVAGHGAAISFRFGDSSSNAAHDAGRMSFLQENSWTSTSTTHDAKFVISLAQNDSLQDRFVIASNGTITAGTQEISGSGIEVGRGSGSVAMTINDGKGNANLTFNHRNGTPDNTSAGQSAGRIECGVDSTNARMYFELGDSTSNGTNVNLTNVMDLDIGVVNVTGDITASGNITAYSSDRRLKENLVRISTPLDKVDQLHGYTFDWKAECEDIGFIPKIQTNDMGLIAQDVQAVVPQAVAIAPFDHELSEDGTEDVSISGENYLTVQYDRLVPLLVEAIKELRQEVEALKAQISGS